mmetsp:Transcript_6558/g.12990  ORF Transcript_6558/g.12990 Transcript_6558/m.12990 type:complete len:205 (+) Transcript_6558:1-615(+)
MEQCCKGMNLRVAVMATDFKPYGYWDEGTGELRGVYKRLWGAIGDVTGISIDFVPTNELSLGFTKEDYSPLINGSWDVQIIDTSRPLAFNAELAKHVFITRSWTEGSLTGLVLRSKTDVGIFQLFQPFTLELWLSLVGATLLFALVTWLFGYLSPTKSDKKDVPNAVYQSFAMLLDGEDQEWTSWPGKILRLGILFLVLIIGAT